MITLVSTALALELVVKEHGTGDPVSGTVRVGEQSSTIGLNGEVQLDLAAGTPITVAAEGYVGVTVSAPENPRLTIWLVREPPPLLVIVQGRRVDPNVSSHKVDGEVAFKTPGNLEDAVRLVQSLPGVAVQREYSPAAGTLSIRGSAPHDSRYFLDGIEIPYLYHFNQYASVFPASQLEELELLPSTFGPAWGDSVGAIVQARSRSDLPQSTHGSAFLNFVVAGGEVRAPLGKGWWTSLGGRRSYQDLNGQTSEQFTLWPVFSDTSLQLEHKGTHTSTGAFLWTANDRYARAAGELDVLDPFEAQVVPRLDFKRGFWVTGLRHRWRNGGDSGRAVAALVGDRLAGTLTGNGSQTSKTLSLQTRVDASHREGPRGWDLGVNVEAEQLALTVTDPGRAALLTAAETPALARGVEVDAVRTRIQGGVYGTVVTGTEHVRLLPGLRIGFDSSSPDATIEPRLGANIRLSNTTSLRLGGGRYAQRPPSEHLFEGTGNPELPTTTSWQVAGGIDQTLAGRLDVQLDGYAKTLQDVLVFPIDGPAEVRAQGTAAGVELTARYRVREVFFMHGWVGVSRSLADGQPTTGDQPINLGLVTSWDPSRHWNLALRYRMGSGLPFTPLQGSLYDAGQDGWIPQPLPMNSERMPLYQKIDLRVEYTLEFKRWSLSANGELWFVPKQSAQLYPAYNFDYTERTWVRGPTLFPLGGLRARW